MFKFHFTNFRQRCVGPSRFDGNRAEERRRSEARRERQADAALGKPEGNTGSSARPVVSGHFSLLCVPFVRVSWRQVGCACWRNREADGTGRIVSFEYLEERGHILFRPARKRRRLPRSRNTRYSLRHFCWPPPPSFLLSHDTTE